MGGECVCSRGSAARGEERRGEKRRERGPAEDEDEAAVLKTDPGGFLLTLKLSFIRFPRLMSNKFTCTFTIRW